MSSGGAWLMPSRAPRLCPTCGSIITGRRCSRCSPSWSRKPQSWRAGSTRRWRTVRAAWLAEHPLCQCIDQEHAHAGTCGALATVVDHDDDTDYETDRYNSEHFRSLCTTCHDKRTAQQGNDARGSTP